MIHIWQIINSDSYNPHFIAQYKKEVARKLGIPGIAIHKSIHIKLNVNQSHKKKTNKYFKKMKTITPKRDAGTM